MFPASGPSSELRGGSFCCYIGPRPFETSAFRPEIGSSHSEAIDGGNSASASMTDGGSAFSGATGTRSRLRSRITTERGCRVTKRLEPIHPGEILEEEFMLPLGLSANALAARIGVPVTRISEVVRGRRGITADTALRLARVFGTSAELWMGLQGEYDLRVARRDVGEAVESRVLPLSRPKDGYGEGTPEGVSHVRDREIPFSSSGARTRTQDRRRIRHPR